MLPSQPQVISDPGNRHQFFFFSSFSFLPVSLILPLVFSFCTLLRLRAGTLGGAQGLSTSWELALAGLSHPASKLDVLPSHSYYYCKVFLLCMSERCIPCPGIP